jgi:PAP2 superfamily
MAGRWWRSRFGGSLVRELVLVVALLLAYKYGRFLARGHVATALHNARGVIDVERSLGVFTEARLQDLVVSSTALVRFLNAYYLAAHVVVTAAAFVWLYVRHPDAYRRFRNVMVAITVVGMSGHLVFPLAPPRMLPRFGFVDTARIFGPASYGAGSPYKGFANQFAAMPSLHFGWALVIAWAAIMASSSRWRYLVLAHPVLTLAAIVLTANHYWLDAVMATMLFGLALGIDRLIERRRAKRRVTTVTDPASERVAACARTSRRSPRPATAGSPRPSRGAPLRRRWAGGRDRSW